jgi:hypothetical protein
VSHRARPTWGLLSRIWHNGLMPYSSCRAPSPHVMITLTGRCSFFVGRGGGSPLWESQNFSVNNSHSSSP